MRLIADRVRLKFSELFEGVTSRSEVVCTFLALLELIRLRQLTAVQTTAFGEIEICRAPNAGTVPAPEPVAAAEAEPVAVDATSSPRAAGTGPG